MEKIFTHVFARRISTFNVHNETRWQLHSCRDGKSLAGFHGLGHGS